MKGFADGSLGSTTAYFFEPYNDAPTTRGLPSDQMFPQGIPIGTVHNVSTSQYGIFQDAEVAPFENFQELQEVMVLLYAPSQNN